MVHPIRTLLYGLFIEPIINILWRITVAFERP
jgi:hypothetical protein